MDENDSLEKKAKNKRILQTVFLTAACLILGVIVAMQFKSISSADKNANQSSSISEYQTEIINLTDQLKLLQDENESLEDKLALIESGTNEEQIENLQKELDDVKKFAGLTRVVGEGVRISISFKDENMLPSAAAAVQMFINELKACDVEAISVNGERLVAMSEIRVVNTYVVINGKTYTQPLDILAIGKQSSIKSMMKMVGGIVSILETRYGATITSTDSGDIVIPAYSNAD